MDSRVIIRRLRRDGWMVRDVRGSHWQFTHPGKPGRVTVVHPRKDTPLGTVRSIERQAGISLRGR